MTVTAVAPSAAGVEVGDFFSSSWGYDQTNVDFYKVVGLTPKGVKVQQWSSKTTYNAGGPTTLVVPGENPRRGWQETKASQEELAACSTCRSETEETYGESSRYTYASKNCETHCRKQVDSPVETKRLSSYDGGKTVYFALTSYSSASPWNGKAMYETGAGWGH